jgi:prepilin signal peptidase PulO-like enzyme (type II secretory pathway)
MSALAACAALLLGGGIGGALNWLAVRLPDGAQDQGGRSQPARWRVMSLPLVSAAFGLALWLRFGADARLAWAGLMTALLLLIAAIDLDRRLVLNAVLLVGAGLAVGRAALAGPAAVAQAVVGGLVGLALFGVLAAFQRGALGAGDVKLAGLLGLILAYPAVLTGLLVGVLAGGVTSAVLLLLRRVGRRSMIPYAPFLSAGGIAALFLATT